MFMNKNVFLKFFIASFFLGNIFLFQLFAGQQKQGTNSNENQPQVLGEIEKQLIEKQIEKEIAQTEYFRQQTTKNSETKSFWQNIKDNTTAIITGTAALIAATIAFISFFFNYRATIRNQRDTQFYEALKRLGDKDSASTRASAAGLLSQMSKTKQGFYKKTKPYYQTSFDLLSNNLILEENVSVINSITNAIKQIGFENKVTALDIFYKHNISLQRDMFDTLASYIAFFDTNFNQLSEVRSDTWDVLTLDTYFNVTVLQSLINRYDIQIFLRGRDVTFLKQKELEYKSRIEYREKIQEKLKTISARLRGTIVILNQILREYDFPDNRNKLLVVQDSIGSVAMLAPILDLKDVFLFEADLSFLNLENVSFYNARLIGCDFRNSNLKRANFVKSVLIGSNFQRANLSDGHLESAIMDGVKAEDANFTKARLNEVSLLPLPYSAWGRETASLNGAFLAEANLSKVKFNQTRLATAQIDEKTDFTDANWWQAEFFGGRRIVGQDVDTNLLNQLYDKYGLDKKIKKEDLNPSVQEFLKSKKQSNNEN